MKDKLKKFINAHSGVDIVKEVITWETKKLDHEVECKLSNGKIKKCLVNKKVFESIKDSVKWT